MHKSQPLFTKWAHLCNQLQLKKQMLPVPKNPFPVYSSHHPQHTLTFQKDFH